MLAMGAYASSVVIMGVLALISIPLMIRVGGVDNWASIAAGQSLGILASIAVAYGWFLTGPAAVAKADVSEIYALYMDSVRLRTVIFLPVTCLAGLVAVLMIRTYDPMFMFLGVASTSVLGLRAQWFFVGRNMPWAMVALDTVPRALLIAVGLAAGWWLQSLVVIVCGQIAGILVSATLATIVIRQRYKSQSNLSAKKISHLLKVDRHGVHASLAGGLYATVPVVLVGALAPQALASYALIDRVWKQLNTAVSPVYDFLYSWVSRSKGDALLSTSARAVLSVAAMQVAVSLLLIFIGPSLMEILGNGTVQVEYAQLLAFAAVFFTAGVSQILTQVVLVVFGEVGRVARLTSVTSLLGLTLCIILVLAWGTVGALAGLGAGYAARVAAGLYIWKSK